MSQPNCIAIGWKTDPKRYASVLIMRKPIHINSVINLGKTEPTKPRTPLVRNLFFSIFFSFLNALVKSQNQKKTNKNKNSIARLPKCHVLFCRKSMAFAQQCKLYKAHPSILMPTDSRGHGWFSHPILHFFHLCHYEIDWEM